MTCKFNQKETLTQVFSCEFCEIFKNIVFIEHAWWLLSKFKEVSIVSWNQNLLHRAFLQSKDFTIVSIHEMLFTKANFEKRIFKYASQSFALVNRK